MNVNNTYIELDAYSAESYGNLSLFNTRPIYYGIHLVSSSFSVEAETFSLIS